MSVLLWGVLPYVMMAILVGGLIWRYRYDQFGWTTRSSQLYESRLLRLGSPLFHFGILVVIIGHFGSLVGATSMLIHGLARTGDDAAVLIRGRRFAGMRLGLFYFGCFASVCCG